MVGDGMIQGISGGQKKRVTTGEILVGPTRALFMDEISTNLESSITFQMINSLRQSIHILNGTTLISLLQPTPETYELLDDIILLSDGQIVYQGPRENVLEFFQHVGFKCPERKRVADFLQEVKSRKDQEQYWENKDEPYNFITIREFSEAFQLFHIGQKLGDELATPFDTSKGHPAVLTKNKYGVSKKELLKACVSRDVKKWWLWGYWVSPIMYGQNAIAVNEFLGQNALQIGVLAAIMGREAGVFNGGSKVERRRK